MALESGAEVDADLLADVRKARDEAIADYGRKFADDYGWARPLFPGHTPNQRVTFRDLEELASLVGLERLEYRVGAHHIHASAWGLELSLVDSGGWVGRVTGSVDVGLAEPAAIALIAALASTTAIVHGIAPMPEPMDLLALRALAKLIEDAMERLAEAQAAIAEVDASPAASAPSSPDDLATT